MTSRRWIIALVLIGATALGLRLAHLVAIHDTPQPLLARTWIESDMYQYRAWARHLDGEGGWLDRPAFRPRFSWMDTVAAPETWEGWLGQEVYYQPPLVTYLIALTMRLTGGLEAFRIFETILGTLNAVLIALLARRLVSPLAGIVAGAIVALYAPFIHYNVTILRSTATNTAHLLAILALHLAGERGRDGRPGWARCLLAGGALGVGALTDSFLLAFTPLAALYLLLDAGRGKEDEPLTLRLRLRALAWVAAGLALALSPLAARNLAAGAPLLATTTRGPFAVVLGNAPGAKPEANTLPPSAGEILDESGYGFLATIAATWRAHGGGMDAALALASLQGRKLWGLLNSFEVPDNPSFEYSASRSPVLAWTLRFACISGPGLLGLALALGAPRRTFVLLLYLASLLGVFAFANVLSRYRQPFVIVITVFAGLFVDWSVRAVRRGARRPAAAAAAAAVLVSLLLPNEPPSGQRRLRHAEFLAGAIALAQRGERRQALSELDLAASHAIAGGARRWEHAEIGSILGDILFEWEDPVPIPPSYSSGKLSDPAGAEALLVAGAKLQDRGRKRSAIPLLRAAVEADPDLAEAHARLGLLLWGEERDAKGALSHLRSAITLAPSSPAAPALRDLVSRIDSNGVQAP